MTRQRILDDRQPEPGGADLTRDRGQRDRTARSTAQCAAAQCRSSGALPSRPSGSVARHPKQREFASAREGRPDGTEETSEPVNESTKEIGVPQTRSCGLPVALDHADFVEPRV